MRDCGDRRKDIGVPEVIPEVLGTESGAANGKARGNLGGCEAAWTGDIKLEGEPRVSCC